MPWQEGLVQPINEQDTSKLKHGAQNSTVRIEKIIFGGV